MTSAEFRGRPSRGTACGLRKCNRRYENLTTYLRRPTGVLLSLSDCLFIALLRFYIHFRDGGYSNWWLHCGVCLARRPDAATITITTTNGETFMSPLALRSSHPDSLLFRLFSNTKERISRRGMSPRRVLLARGQKLNSCYTRF